MKPFTSVMGIYLKLLVQHLSLMGPKSTGQRVVDLQRFGSTIESGNQLKVIISIKPSGISYQLFATPFRRPALRNWDIDLLLTETLHPQEKRR